MNWAKTAIEETGHNSLEDMIQNAFHIKLHLSAIHLFAVTFGGILALAESITESWIYSPALGVGVLFACTVIDLILGIACAIKIKEPLNVSRIGRAFIRFIVQVLFVGLLFNMSKTWHTFIQMWMVDILLIIFTLTTFYSAIENAHTLRLIDKNQFDFIRSIVNIKDLINKLKSKK